MAPGTLLRNDESTPLEQNKYFPPAAALNLDHLPGGSVTISDSNSQSHGSAELDSDESRNSREEMRNGSHFSDIGDVVDQQERRLGDQYEESFDSQKGKTVVSQPKETSVDQQKEEETTQHLTTLERFAENMSDAAKRILGKRTEFKRVVVVISYWQKSPNLPLKDPRNLPHLEKNAKRLVELFRDQYKFEVLEYPIPRTNSSRNFTSTIGPEIDKVSEDPESLFILYYGGHATRKPRSSQCSWVAPSDNLEMSSKIPWTSAQQSLFEGAECRKLFILDCCHAGAMIDQSMEWNGSCELLGASSPEVEASALEVSSFTKAVWKELRDNVYDIWELHSALCSTEKKSDYQLNVDVWYRDFTMRKYPSAVIRKLRSSLDEKSAMTTLNQLRKSDARILIKVTFKGSAAGFLQEFNEILQDWSRWFRSSPKDIQEVGMKAVRQADLVSLFESNSCIAIWSMPVWLWDAMTVTGSYQYLGVIRSENFVALKSADLKPLRIRRKASVETVESWQLPKTSNARRSALIESEVRPPTETTNSSATNPSRVEKHAPVPSRKDSPKFHLLRHGTGLSFLKREKTNSANTLPPPPQSRPSPKADAPPLILPLDTFDDEYLSFLKIPPTQGKLLRLEDIVGNDKKSARKIDNFKASNDIGTLLNALRWGSEAQASSALMLSMG